MRYQIGDRDIQDRAGQGLAGQGGREDDRSTFHSDAQGGLARREPG